MTDLLTRIRSFIVEATPPHSCKNCDGILPETCFHAPAPDVKHSRQAYALLREVAALEPVAYVATTHVKWMKVKNQGMKLTLYRKKEPTGLVAMTPIYTLTGATHD